MKSIFKSKTFYANIIAVLAMTIQGITGKEIVSIEMQGTILAVVNIILRTVTKEAVKW